MFMLLAWLLHFVGYLRRVWLPLYCQPRRYRRIDEPNVPRPVRRRQCKPEWVRQEIIRLKALMPHSGCRKIAAST